MGKSEEWQQENPYDMEINENAELVLIRTDTNSLISLKREILPNNSVTKQLLFDLKILFSETPKIEEKING